MNDANTNANPSPFAHIGNTLPKRSSVIEATTVQAFKAAPLTEASSNACGAAESPDTKLNFGRLHHKTPVVSLMAQVQNWTLAWAGRISCTLHTSVGDIIVHTNREKLPIEIQDGSWVHVKLLLARSSNSWHTLLSATLVFPSEEDPKVAWLPVAAYANKSHMYRLRQLLSKFNPSVQAIFMGAMAAPTVQQGFFARVSARDHHEGLGGLFEHSIHAAEIAHANLNLSKQERDIAALTCLLFDLGKANDPCVRVDGNRIAAGLYPHPMTIRLLDPALKMVEGWNPELVAQVRFLLKDRTSLSSQTAAEVPTIPQQCITQAIVQSWQMDPDATQAAGGQKGGLQ